MTLPREVVPGRDYRSPALVLNDRSSVAPTKLPTTPSSIVWALAVQRSKVEVNVAISISVAKHHHPDIHDHQTRAFHPRAAIDDLTRDSAWLPAHPATAMRNTERGVASFAQDRAPFVLLSRPGAFPAPTRLSFERGPPPGHSAVFRFALGQGLIIAADRDASLR
jgi:hypothetical protein